MGYETAKYYGNHLSLKSLKELRHDSSLQFCTVQNYCQIEGNHKMYNAHGKIEKC